MKKNYQKPEMKVVLLQHQYQLLAGSIQSNVGLKDGGGGRGPARARGIGDWDDDEE